MDRIESELDNERVVKRNGKIFPFLKTMIKDTFFYEKDLNVWKMYD